MWVKAHYEMARLRNFFLKFLHSSVDPPVFSGGSRYFLIAQVASDETISYCQADLEAAYAQEFYSTIRAFNSVLLSKATLTTSEACV